MESSSRPIKRQAMEDPEGRMPGPGQLPTGEALPKDYTQRKSDAVYYPKETVFAELFLQFAFTDWHVSLSKKNDAVAEQNNNYPSKKG